MLCLAPHQILYGLLVWCQIARAFANSSTSLFLFVRVSVREREKILTIGILLLVQFYFKQHAKMSLTFLACEKF